MSSTRSTREVETREYEGWDLDNYEEEPSALSLPAGVARPGFALRAVRMEVRGEDDYNYSTALKQGWKPIPASRMPYRLPVDPINRRAELSEFITVNDVIFCERPDILQTKAREAFHKLKYDTVAPLAEAYRERTDTGIRPTRYIEGFR